MVHCANENGTCSCDNTVGYGNPGYFNYLPTSGGTIACDDSTFGDPRAGATKACYCFTDAVTPPYRTPNIPVTETFTISETDKDGTLYDSNLIKAYITVWSFNENDAQPTTSPVKSSHTYNAKITSTVRTAGLADFVTEFGPITITINSICIPTPLCNLSTVYNLGW